MAYRAILHFDEHDEFIFLRRVVFCIFNLTYLVNGFHFYVICRSDTLVILAVEHRVNARLVALSGSGGVY